MRNPNPLESAGDRMEERLALVHPRAGPATDAWVSGVHIGCIAAGALHCRMFLDPHDAPSNAHELCCRYDPERVCWPRPKACRGSCPLKAPVASLRLRFLPHSSRQA